jgi:hypothetical protein
LIINNFKLKNLDLKMKLVNNENKILFFLLWNNRVFNVPIIIKYHKNFCFKNKLYHINLAFRKIKRERKERKTLNL